MVTQGSPKSLTAVRFRPPGPCIHAPMAEWSKATACKAVKSQVRILLGAPDLKEHTVTRETLTNINELERWDYNDREVLYNNSPDLDESGWKPADPVFVFSTIRKLIEDRNTLRELFQGARPEDVNFSSLSDEVLLRVFHYSLLYSQSTQDVDATTIAYSAYNELKAETRSSVSHDRIMEIINTVCTEEWRALQ